MNSVSVIEKAAKLSFGVKVCVVATAALLSFTLVLFTLTSKSLGGSYATAVYTIHSLKINMFSLVFASFYSILIFGLVSAVVGLITVFYSHKIAGPIFRMERSLEAIKDGNLTVSTRFRTGDQLFGAADEMNAMVKALNNTVRSIDDALGEVERAENRLKEAAVGAPTAGADEALNEAVIALGRSVESVSNACSRIKTKG